MITNRFTTAAIVLSCLNLLLAPFPGAANEASSEIGTIKWVIVETETGKVLSTGERSLLVADVEITKNQDLFRKSITLPGNFYFSLCDNATRDKEPNQGFGLSGRRLSEKTFGWDWFNVDRPGHAKKLQEIGELSFDVRKTPNGVEIYRMKFLTDVSIRIVRMSDWNPLNPRWRVNILKGSAVNWPYLQNGDVKGTSFSLK